MLEDGSSAVGGWPYHRFDDRSRPSALVSVLKQFGFTSHDPNGLDRYAEDLSKWRPSVTGHQEDDQGDRKTAGVTVTSMRVLEESAIPFVVDLSCDVRWARWEDREDVSILPTRNRG